MKTNSILTGIIVVLILLNIFYKKKCPAIICPVITCPPLEPCPALDPCPVCAGCPVLDPCPVCEECPPKDPCPILEPCPVCPEDVWQPETLGILNHPNFYLTNGQSVSYGEKAIVTRNTYDEDCSIMCDIDDNCGAFTYEIDPIRSCGFYYNPITVGTEDIKEKQYYVKRHLP